MLTRVVIASNALATAELSPPTANLVHNTFLDWINAHGRLVVGTDPEMSALVRAIRSGEGIPPGVRTRWIETLVRLKKNGRIKVLHDRSPLATATALDRLRTEWGPAADLAVIAAEARDALGIPEDPGYATTPGASPDVATTSSAVTCPSTRRVRTLADVGIAEHGTFRDDFWEQVLEPLATEARSIAVLDGYLFRSLWDGSAQKSVTRGQVTEQVVWLLEHLDRVMAPDAQVRLIGNLPAKTAQVSPEGTARAIIGMWNPAAAGQIGSVRLELAAPKRGERFPHDRHIRFSTGSAIEVSAGLDRLRESRIWDPYGMKWKYIWHPDALASLQRAESQAAEYVRHPPTNVLTR